MGTQNKMMDLNNHLFAQLERLSDESIKGDNLKEEIVRAKAVKDIASQIIATGNLALKAEIAKGNTMNGEFNTPKMLTD